MLQTVVLEKIPDSSLDYKEIKPVNPKGNQPWTFIRRTDAEAEAPILWLSDAKSWLIGKDPDAGRDWRQEEKGTSEDKWIASLTQWTWVWANSGRWWRTGKPGMLQSMRSAKSWIQLNSWTTMSNSHIPTTCILHLSSAILALSHIHPLSNHHSILFTFMCTYFLVSFRYPYTLSLDIACLSLQFNICLHHFLDKFFLKYILEIKKMWCVYTMEYYSAIKRNEIGSYLEM